MRLYGIMVRHRLMGLSRFLWSQRRVGAVAMMPPVMAGGASKVVVRRIAPVPAVMDVASSAAHPLMRFVILVEGLWTMVPTGLISPSGSVPVVIPSLIVHRALLDPVPIGRSP
ncbi:hypothetical protein [Microvirga sp. Mcv34]|uniref:hypothetical protein n=1 Tax=Microvirga sp. Mcv34 TaxID=2926016 RepID=UPI0021C7A036|nr:hypothetical protein [Microvirga sp. Mcv34]